MKRNLERAPLFAPPRLFFQILSSLSLSRPPDQGFESHRRLLFFSSLFYLSPKRAFSRSLPQFLSADHLLLFVASNPGLIHSSSPLSSFFAPLQQLTWRSQASTLICRGLSSPGSGHDGGHRTRMPSFFASPIFFLPPTLMTFMKRWHCELLDHPLPFIGYGRCA